MKFESREQFMETVMPLREGYVCSSQALEHTKKVDLTLVVGPAGVGKDTIMTLTEIPKVISDTIRGIRSNNGVLEIDGVHYNFRDNDLEGVYRDIATGQYLQWALGPNNNIYGSKHTSYPDEGPALIDVVANAVQEIRGLKPYLNSLETAYVVADSYESWIKRFKGRGEISEDQFNGRLLEAHDSLEIGLEDELMHFIVNDDREVAASKLKRLAYRESSRHDEERAKIFGAQMLLGIKKELGLPINL